MSALYLVSIHFAEKLPRNNTSVFAGVAWNNQRSHKCLNADVQKHAEFTVTSPILQEISPKHTTSSWKEAMRLGVTYLLFVLEGDIFFRARWSNELRVAPKIDPRHYYFQAPARTSSWPQPKILQSLKCNHCKYLLWPHKNCFYSNRFVVSLAWVLRAEYTSLTFVNRPP